jgi:hypothetical protein
MSPKSTKIIARVVNAAGRAFNVRLVRQGDRYGLDDCLAHDCAEPLVEFWDASLENDPRFTKGLGQFVSRYYLGTLTGKEGFSSQRDSRIYGIHLCGHVPEWKVTGDNIVAAIAAAEAALGAVP